MKVGYVPYSKDLQHPGDRRRLAAWAIDQQIKLNLTDPLDSDLLVLSNAANFDFWIKRADQPVVLDLVDGYLGEHPTFLKDVLRNIVRTLRGTSKLRWITYTNHLRNACLKSDAVIVASKEQRDVILKFNKNVFVILDDHSELDSASSVTGNSPNELPLLPTSNNLFWEGFGYTLKHFQAIAPDLDKFLYENDWGMYLLTNEQFPRWGGYIGNVKTRLLVEKWFPLSEHAIQVIPWSIENLIEIANHSKLGIIPIDTHDRFATLKPENKLLSMWHLGLPVIFSNTPAYSRIASEANEERACIGKGDWLAALTFFTQSTSEREELKKSGLDYISEHHTHRILINKWKDALEFVITSRPEGS